MDRHAAPALSESIAATLNWWREAGVDCAFLDEPQRWLADPEKQTPAARIEVKSAPPPEPERPRIGGAPESWPQDLAAFHRWWLEEPSLDPIGGRRIPPRGSAGARLMVLVAMPEEDDRETLLSGKQGQLIASMALAMGIADEQLSVASALPCHITLPDWPALARDGMGEVLRHHLALAAPERLLVLGGDILPLLGHDPAQASSAIQQLEIGGRALPLLASYAPAHLLDHARLRARLWRQWLDWTDDEER